ncbi:MAG TPA: YdeI/OmpD-associated family protein [Kofleriaceae bacterium]|nr:YdeI/OmpD-associated family protein [Kofleriaceae bacterium]
MATLAQKLHVKPGMTMCVLDAPSGCQLELGTLAGVKQVKAPKGAIDVLLVFVTRKAPLDKRLPALRAAMDARSALWVCYPKANGLGTDLSRDTLRLALGEKGLTAVSQIAIDDVWSALRFRRSDQPMPGRAARLPPGRTFTTQLVHDGGVEVPFDVEQAFGRKRLPIVVTVNDVTYRTTVAVYGGRYFFPMRRAIREQAGVAANGKVTVTIEPDLAPRVIEAPPDLRKALRAHAAAHARWKTASYTHRKEMVDWVTSAKRAETRARRVEKAIAMLVRAA